MIFSITIHLECIFKIPSAQLAVTGLWLSLGSEIIKIDFQALLATTPYLFKKKIFSKQDSYGHFILYATLATYVVYWLQYYHSLTAQAYLCQFFFYNLFSVFMTIR